MSRVRVPSFAPSFLNKRDALVSVLQALFFGIIQGLCEFFPISSSAHLQFFRYFFNIDEGQTSPIFELVCNLGTTLAAIIFLRKRLIEIILRERKTLIFLALAIAPLVPMYLMFGSIKALTHKMGLIGLFFIFTSILLFFASNQNIEKKSNSSLNRKIRDMLFIGFMQSLALIPGISRSGSTISAGCMRGLDIKDAVAFSFILAIPTILGGSFLEVMKLYISKEPVLEMSLINYIIGFTTSFAVGLFSIRYIFSISSNKKLLPFAWYCLILGIISLIYFNLF